MKTLRKRRTKPAEKTVDRREDELPWEVPIPFDPTFLPTSIYKTAFTSPTLFPSPSIQNALEPYYSYSYTVDKNTAMLQSLGKSANMESGPGGYDSACVSSPIKLRCLSQARETSNSCPAISVPDGTSLSGKIEMPSTSGNGKMLPPIGVFWDIENCAVPKGRSALVAVQRIRERFFIDHLEAEFVCVCDIRKEAPTVIQELNDAQVSVVHVSGNSKNAADDKLRQAMRRFADISCANPINSAWPHPATVILISGDINFATDLSDLRYRKRLYIILLHNIQTPDALLVCAHERYVFHSVLSDLPFRSGYKDSTENNFTIPLKGGLHRVDVLVTGLPEYTNHKTLIFIRNRLRKLSENCGGKVLSVRGEWALIRFGNFDDALRASKRMNGEDVLGNKIRVVCSPHREYIASESYPNNFPEEVSGGIFNMQLNKSNQAGLHSKVWNPTWKRTSDSFRPSSSRYHSTETSSRYNQPSTTAASNSSTPNETSRDGSPSLAKTHNVHSVSVQPAQLNNSAQYQPCNQLSAPASNSTATNQLFAFHQNLYPNVEMGMHTNLRQECQTPPQHLHSDVHGAAGPRLYSTLNNCDGSASVPVQPLGNANQHNFSMQVDLNKLSSPICNGIMIPQTTYSQYSSTSIVESQSAGGTAVMNGNTGNYSKFRGSDGDAFDLNVTNIDPAIGDWKTIRSALNLAFSEYVSVRGIWVYTASDGSATAVVRLNNKEDAQFVLAKLQRRKIGNKRIFISFDEGYSVDHETLKKEVGSLLQDVPHHTLPLFKFREMFEKRYKRSVSSSDLYRMKDVVQIAETTTNANGISTPSSGRNISLTADWQKKDGKSLDLYCKLHPRGGGKTDKLRMGWAEKEAEVMLPNVIIEIKVLGTRIHSLLQSHDGSFPLISFLDCYESEFGELERASEGRGVPLEHLISCVQGVEIVFGENGMKRIQWHEKKDAVDHNVNSQLATQLTQFGRELIDLLKTFPKCTLPFARLIPSYHAHFGRQCRVADYGHFSLSALLQTLPHIVQIMGAAQNRVLTLSHRAQMKRFATDMLRVLKSQGGLKKQIYMDEFSSAFSNVFPQRQFQPEDYGLCYFSDLVTELVEHSTLVALIKDEDGKNMLAVPKREQTPQEIHRTRIFATEVVELLRHSTRCELEFSKFVPYYHHHFQKQCRVSEYGFSKLAELFDAISDTVVILNPGVTDCATEDKIIRLTPNEQTKVVGEQVCAIIEKRLSNGESTHLDDLVDCFLEEHGFLLRPELCDASSVEDLLYSKLENYVKIENGEIVPVDRVQIEDLSKKAEIILQQAPEYKMDVDEFMSALSEQCENMDIDEVLVERDLNSIVSLDADGDGESRKVSLEPLRIFAYEIAQLLEEHGGILPLPTLENSYYQKYGRPLRPAQLGYPTVLPMLQAIPDIVTLRGKHRTKKVIVLNSCKSAIESSASDESSLSNGVQTPRSGSGGEYWKHRGSRPHSTGSGSKYGRYNDWTNSPRRRSAPPPPLFSPLSSPAFAPQPVEGNTFGFDRPTPLSPPVYDVWMQESVAPGSPPMSPPVVWTCHPIFYPSSPPPGGPGNILVTSPYVGPAPWSPPPVNATCYDRVVPPAQPVTMLGNEFLFGQNRFSATFEGLTVDTGNEA